MPKENEGGKAEMPSEDKTPAVVRQASQSPQVRTPAYTLDYWKIGLL
jgi:hypothetical protein